MNSMKKQDGAVLFIALIIVTVLSILVTASVRSSLLQQKMATNLRDRDMTFQAAETSLKKGESYIQTVDPLPVFDNTNGLYSFSNSRTFANQSDWANLNTSTLTQALHQITTSPNYIIEKIELVDTVGESLDASKPVTSNYYRITSKAESGASTVIVQSIFRR